MNYFNEIDRHACAVMREVHGGHVDERDIRLVRPIDIWGFERCHWFAGAGCWEIACEQADWQGPIWTASCPCQPFSVAGKGRGVLDERHLWPDLFRLVDACRPRIVVGEQVGSLLGRRWFDGVRSDLEGIGYACWAVDIPAAAVDAPHRRNRLYWVAMEHATGVRRDGWSRGAQADGRDLRERERVAPNANETLADSKHTERWPSDDARRSDNSAEAQKWFQSTIKPGKRDGSSRLVVDAAGERRPEGWAEHELFGGRNAAAFPDGGVAVTLRGGRQGDARDEFSESSNVGKTDRGYWADAEWIDCADGKKRRSKRGLSLLADGVAGRADLWRLAGNSICIPLAVEVLRALKETLS